MPDVESGPMDCRIAIIAIFAAGVGASIAEWFDAPAYVTSVLVGAAVVVALLLGRKRNGANTVERER